MCVCFAMSSEPLVRMPDDLIEEYWKGKAKEKKKENNPAEFFKNYCEKEPWQVECKEYDV